jgi:hypothetical protein
VHLQASVVDVLLLLLLLLLVLSMGALLDVSRA